MLKKNISMITTVLILSTNYSSAQAGWSDMFTEATKVVTENGGNDLVKSTLANSDAVSGLKEALANGVESAIKALGTSGGFAGNDLVKIAVPDSLKTIVATARAMGQGEKIDSFESTMNQAAEKAVPEAATILANAIRDMSVDDAVNIVNGSDDSATQYFRKMAEASLTEKFKPIVSQATDSAGVTMAYKSLTAQASNPLTNSLLGGSSLDLDQYVTNKALDGLFKYIAIEEKNIRSNPASRTTDLLKKVFGQ